MSCKNPPGNSTALNEKQSQVKQLIFRRAEIQNGIIYHFINSTFTSLVILCTYSEILKAIQKCAPVFFLYKQSMTHIVASTSSAPTLYSCTLWGTSASDIRAKIPKMHRSPMTCTLHPTHLNLQNQAFVSHIQEEMSQTRRGETQNASARLQIETAKCS